MLTALDTAEWRLVGDFYQLAHPGAQGALAAIWPRGDVWVWATYHVDGSRADGKLPTLKEAMEQVEQLCDAQGEL
jgi:hypothetical protein